MASPNPWSIPIWKSVKPRDVWSDGPTRLRICRSTKANSVVITSTKRPYQADSGALGSARPTLTSVAETARAPLSIAFLLPNWGAEPLTTRWRTKKKQDDFLVNYSRGTGQQEE